MVILVFLFGIVAAEDLSELVTKQKELGNQLGEVADLVHELRDITSDTYITKLTSEINVLKEEILKVTSSVDFFEEAINDLYTQKETFDSNRADEVIKSVASLVEKVSVLEGKLINLDDKELIDKIEEAMKGIASSDTQIKNTVYKLKEQTEYLESLVNKDTKFFWVYFLIGLIGVGLFLSWRILDKAKEV